MSNLVIEQLQKRKSIREFTQESVSNEDLELILKTAQRAPTSINGQQITLIYTRDKKLIKTISELCGKQPQIAAADIFITIVMDFNRTNYALKSIGKKQVIPKSAEGIMVGSVDAGIMLNAIQVASESLGYGTTAIGSVRENSKEISKLLDLPQNTFAVVGTTIGVPTKQAKQAPLKPRISFKSFALEDKYDDKKVKEGISLYDEKLRKFRDDTGTADLMSYNDLTSAFYSKIYFKIAKALRDQGFEFTDNIE